MHKLESCCPSLWFFVAVIGLVACDTPTDLPIKVEPLSPTSTPQPATDLIVSDVTIVNPYLKQCIKNRDKTFVNEIIEIQCDLKPTDHTHLAITDLSGIEQFTQLKILNLSGLNQANLTTISELTQLTELRLTQSDISDISALATLQQLTILDLSDNENLNCNDRIAFANLRQAGLNVFLPPRCNEPPDIDISDNLIVHENTLVTLDGSKSTDENGTITTYFWEQIIDSITIDLDNANTSQASFIAPEIQDKPIVLRFQLTVTDDQKKSTIAILTVNVIDKNQPPTVDPVAGNEGNLSTTPTVNEETIVLLKANAIDNDGSILKYEWQRIDGVRVKEIRHRDQEQASFTTPVTTTQTSITFEIKVTDNKGASTSTPITVTINPVNTLPTANAGLDTEADERTSVTLRGLGEDKNPDGSFDGFIDTYQWRQKEDDNTKVNLIQPSSAEGIATFIAPSINVDTLLTFILTVTDDEGATAADELQITIEPLTEGSPIADAGGPQSINEAQLVTLNGEQSKDSNGGTIDAYEWTILSIEPPIDPPLNVNWLTSAANLPFTLPNDATPKTVSFVTPIVKTETVIMVQLKVMDDDELTSTNAATIVVNPVNMLPMAAFLVEGYTGDVIEINEQTEVTLDASASTDTDGRVITYEWINVSSDNFPDPLVFTPNTPENAVITKFVTPTATANQPIESRQLKIRLTVTDDENNQNPASDVTTTPQHFEIPITILPVNDSPIAIITVDTGDDGKIFEKELVELNASNSSDPDTIEGDILLYQWELLTQDSSVELINATTAKVSFTAPETLIPLVLDFKVTVTDPEGDFATTTTTVTIDPQNDPPVANAGPDQISAVGELVTLMGSGSDSDLPNDPNGDTLIYQWTLPNNVVVPEGFNINAKQPSFTVTEGTAAAKYTFTLNVFDAENLSSTQPDTVDVIIDNSAPTANTGEDRNIDPGQTITLDGSLSKDPNGDTLTYQWIAPTGIILSNINTIQPTFDVPTMAGGTSLTFELTVNDAGIESSSATVTFIVNNLIPEANAGNNQIAKVGDVVTLDGSGSQDPNEPIHQLKFQWRSLNDKIILSDLTTIKPTFTVPEGISDTLTFELIVTDTENLPSPVATTRVSINNTKPIANAGADKIVAAGTLVTLDGSASKDPNNDTLSYQWSAPSGITLNNIATATPSFTHNTPGTFTFTLIVNDGTENSAPDDVIMTFTNRTPTAAFTVSPTAISVDTNVVLDASASSDPDTGDTLTYTWTSPQVTTLSNTKLSNFTVTAAMGNTIDITLTVSDGQGGSDTIAVTLTVTDPPPNNPPIANAGADQAVAAGDMVTLDGSGSTDLENNPLLYEWRTTTNIVLSNINAKQPTFSILADRSGMLDFTLTVTEDRTGGQSATDTVSLFIIGDASLKTCINTQANTAAITDYTQITALTCPNLAIVSLTGINQLTGLTTLDFSSNSINNVTPLASITGLTELNLANNSTTTSISSLIDLTDLTRLDLSENTITCADYNQLNTTFAGIDLTLPPDPCPPAITISDFVDPVLRSCVAAADITGFIEDMLTLDCSAFSGISTLNGIEQLTHLQKLDISGHNAIACAELTPLQSTITTVVWPTGCAANLNLTVSPTETTIALQWDNVEADEYILQNMTSGSLAISNTTSYTDGTVNPLVSGTSYSYELTASFFGGVTQSEVNRISVATLLPPTTDLLSLSEDASADLDTGTITALDADIWFEFVSATERYITPKNAAKIAFYTADTAPTRDACMGLLGSLTTNRIPVNDTTANKSVCLLTTLNRISTFQITAPIATSPGALNIDFTTWNPPLP